MICIIDNYDSFTYNLYQYIGEFEPDIAVIRNDKASAAEVAALNPTHIVLSPGPGRPEDAGICTELVEKYGKKFPILGICLGHQAIGAALGAVVEKATAIVHGKQSVIYNQGQGIFNGLPAEFTGGRYHSLMVRRQSLPECLEVHAYSEDQTIMAIAHKEYPIFGLQFHPESILTEQGKTLLYNFFKIKRSIR